MLYTGSEEGAASILPVRAFSTLYKIVKNFEPGQANVYHSKPNMVYVSMGCDNE